MQERYQNQHREKRRTREHGHRSIFSLDCGFVVHRNVDDSKNLDED
jgi:hypothetical protein